MRELLFRGKRIDNGEWIESGTLVHFVEGDQFFIPPAYSPCTCVHSAETDNIEKFDECNFIKVYPETVGQYIGLTDKNGKKIFEGDILKFTLVENDGYSSESFYRVYWHGGGWWSQCKHYMPEQFNQEDASDMELAGNIYDNPELLGE